MRPLQKLAPVNGKMDICYNVQASADAERKLIAGFEVTNNVNDMNLLTPMTEKVMEILEAGPMAAAADKDLAVK
jgi:hypothetical protein